MDNFFKDLQNVGNNIYNTVHTFTNGNAQTHTVPNTPSPNGIQQLAQNFGNWIGSEAGQAYSKVQQLGSSLVNSGLIGLNTNNPVNNWIAQTPNYIGQGVHSIQSAIPGQGFLPNVARNTVEGVGNILSIPGVAAQIGQQPSYALPVAEGMVRGLGHDVGFDDQGNWSLQNIGTNFYQRPVTTVLDLLPAAGLLGKLGKAGKVGEIGEGASIADKLQALKTAVAPENTFDYTSPQQARIQLQPGKDVLNELFSLEDQTAAGKEAAKGKLDNLLNSGTDLLNRGFTKKQVDGISSSMAQDIIVSTTQFTKIFFYDFFRNCLA